MSEEQLNQGQAFQQAITTTITCRTLIKYNSNLSAEQKAEIFTEIDATLAFLGKCLEGNVGNEAGAALPPDKQTGLPATEDEEESIPSTMPEYEQSVTGDEKQISLQQLYQLYQAYLNNEPGKGIAALETRYKTVMSVLDQLETLAELRHDVTASDLTIDGLLSRIRGFITAVYYMFREFAALLTKIVEGQNIDVDTEAMALLQEYPRETVQQLVYDIAPLMYVYQKQRQLQRRKGSLRENAREATAFLIFLQNGLEQTFTRRQDIIAQIKNTTSLLNDLMNLLSDYELAIATITQSPSTS